MTILVPTLITSGLDRVVGGASPKYPHLAPALAQKVCAAATANADDLRSLNYAAGQLLITKLSPDQRTRIGNEYADLRDNISILDEYRAAYCK